MSKMSWFVFAGSMVLTAPASRAEPSTDSPREQRPEAPLEVTIDKSTVDLEAHSLEVRMSRPAGHVKLTVRAASGEVLAEDDLDFRGKAADCALVVRWTPKSQEPVARIEVFAYDSEGNYKGIAIIPWSLEIPHEEVNFATNSATIDRAEEPKLEKSLALVQQASNAHEDLGPVTLFIAGHTDTRGSAEHNRDLSRRRARAIASWFREHGLRVPIAYAGFGEQALKVKTLDEVSEQRNRRVDYVLAIDPPRLKSSGAPVPWAKL